MAPTSSATSFRTAHREAYTDLLVTSICTPTSKWTHKAAFILGKASPRLRRLNLNNEVFGFYFGSEPYWTQREYYQPSYTFGLRWDLHHERP